jgi:hypothetical protein
MRFACQSCGKAYNLPEEKIADKSNVKLKCRVCGAIVEVKKQGEVVAAMLGEGDNKRRLSEAPAPLTSMMPDDSDDATHAIAVSDQILSEGSAGEDAAAALMGHVKSALSQRGGLGPLPPPPPTGFGSPPPPVFASALPAPAFSAPAPPGFTPVPPPLSVPDLPRPEPPFAPPFPSVSRESVSRESVSRESVSRDTGLGASGPAAPPPPLPNLGVESLHVPGLSPPSLNGPPGLGGSLQNRSNGAGRFGDAIPLPDELLPPPVAMAAGGIAALSPGLAMPGADIGSYAGPPPVDMQQPALQQPPVGDDTTRKMLAALATGILIGFIIARLFF